MPKKAKKPCAVYGCPELVHGGGRFCAKHAKSHNRDYERFCRDPNTAKRYDTRWRKISAAFLWANPLCEVCEKSGRLTPAVLVHHRKAVKDGGTHNTDNLMALCNSCHEKIHIEQGERF